nr:alkaline shock response membrane anchor protein AmaP [Paenibacillus hamazuiensis]
MLDRLLLFLYTLAVLVGSALALAAAFAWIPYEDAGRFLRDVYYDQKIAFTFIPCMIVLFLISIRFFYIAVRPGRAQAPSIDQRTEFGDIRISIDTVENLALKAANRTRGVKDLKSRVRVNHAGLDITIRAIVDGENSIPALTEEMQGAVKRHVEEITGIPVAMVSVYVANIQQTAPTFRSRVE